MSGGPYRIPAEPEPVVLRPATDWLRVASIAWLVTILGGGSTALVVLAPEAAAMIGSFILIAAVAVLTIAAVSYLVEGDSP